jgi:hypothetical protein
MLRWQIIWMAQQTEVIKRAAAVNLFKAGMDSGNVLEHFNAERQLTSAGMAVTVTHSRRSSSVDRGILSSSSSPPQNCRVSEKYLMILRLARQS